MDPKLKLFLMVLLGALWLLNGSRTPARAGQSHGPGQEIGSRETGAHGNEESEAADSEKEGAHGSGEHHKMWWQVPGYSTIFGIAGCLYFLLTLKALPKLIAREESHGE